MGTEERDPMLCTEQTASCFGAIGLPDDASAAFVRERLADELEEIRKANQRVMDYSIKIDLPY